MSEEQQPETFEEAFQHLEHDSDTERSFMRRHREVAEEEKATDERRRQEVQDATQHDFERGITYERRGDGDGTVTHRMPGPNHGHLQNQSEGHLSRSDREEYSAELEPRLANDGSPLDGDWAEQLADAYLRTQSKRRRQ
jgi:hypothetical protein